MKRVLKLSLLVVPMIGLSGCHSFPLTSWMFKRSEPSLAAAPKVDGAQSLEEGRAALQANRPAAAIVPLRIAMLDPALRPQASNALGVAYAQMGRDDLAERFFKAAIAADPTDTRFSDNLLRLQTAVLARQVKANEARLARASSTSDAEASGFVLAPNSPVRPASQAQPASGIAQRRSRAEVFIPSATQSSAPSATVAFATPKVAKATPAKSASPADSDQIELRVVASPIRINLAEVPVAKPAPATAEPDQKRR